MSAADALTATFVAGACLSPLTITAGIMYRQWRREAAKEQRALQQARDGKLYRLLRCNKGQVTLTQYVIDSALPVEEARTHLEQRAKELSARCEVTEQGQVVYYFEL